ncbi:hypothetical protein [Streptomyces sp. G-G2]|uniref:hypothetical protein n=1 Tax=Streptomyces sp. G-G2 TaxID=3046201 RepID=UPI0024BBB633|nr:hypothetical protein [Streptomyces sp. G-G2]MDJ0383966.1 hypothetical protein [Streptomyces sp. G-G2]
MRGHLTISATIPAHARRAGGARARLLLSRAYAATGRQAEALEVLQSALADLAGHGEHMEVQARELLGDLPAELHDPAGAAEQYLLAADLTKDRADQRARAHLAQSRPTPCRVPECARRRPPRTPGAGAAQDDRERATPTSAPST